MANPWIGFCTCGATFRWATLAEAERWYDWHLFQCEAAQRAICISYDPAAPAPRVEARDV